MNKSKTIIIGVCGSEALGVLRAMLKCSDVQRVVSIETKSNKTTKDQLKDLGYSGSYSEAIFRRLNDLESINNAKVLIEGNFKGFNEPFEEFKPIHEERKSKYINKPRYNFRK